MEGTVIQMDFEQEMDEFNSKPRPLKRNWIPTVCEHCKFPALGTFTIIKHDWEQGEVNLIKRLCKLHKEMWESQGASVTPLV